MKNLFICLALTFLLTGCMGTKDYYQSQVAYYNAQAQAHQAYINAQNNRQPLAEMTAPDGTKFVVNQTSLMPMPAIQTTENPIVAGLKTIVNSTPLAIVAGGWTAKQVLQNSQGDIHASDNAQVTSTTNSNNATDLRNSDGDISEDNSNNSVNDSYNATAEPTIVEQPDYNEPIIVRPEIVKQPPYNEPIIVQN